MEKIIKLFKNQITSTVLSVILGFLVAALILTAAGYDPLHSFGALFKGIYSRPKYLSNTVIKSTPIILTGLSVAFALRTGLLNMGAEGQYILSTVAVTTLGILLNLPSIIQIPILLLAGIAAGALFGGITGLLKAKFGIHEVITGIMLNWIALYFNNFVANMVLFHKPNSSGTYSINEAGYTVILNQFKKSAEGKAMLSASGGWGEMLLKTDVNTGIILAVTAVIALSILLNRSSKGYELRAVGKNQAAAELGGIDVKKNIIHSMLIAGAVAGMAGALTITGMAPHKISVLAAFENYGWNGLSVALIAGGSPIGCLFSGLLFGGLLYGGQSIQSEVGAPSEIIQIMLGTIVFFIALTKTVPFLAERFERRGGKNGK